MNTEIFLPTLRSFTNGNTFSGSCGPLRFLLTPKVEEGSIEAKIWHGRFCIEKSTVEETAEFPMTPEGVETLRTYLTDHVEA